MGSFFWQLIYPHLSMPLSRAILLGRYWETKIEVAAEAKWSNQSKGLTKRRIQFWHSPECTKVHEVLAFRIRVQSTGKINLQSALCIKSAKELETKLNTNSVTLQTSPRESQIVVTLTATGIFKQNGPLTHDCRAFQEENPNVFRILNPQQYSWALHLAYKVLQMNPKGQCMMVPS